MNSIIVINQDSGYLMIDIANTLSERGIEVSLVTGQLTKRDTPISDSINLHKIIRYNRESKFKRLITWLIAFMQILFLVKTKFRKNYLLIITNPPLASFMPLFCKNRFSLMIFDIYPDSLVKTGIIKDTSLICRNWRKINNRVFPKADHIFTLTDKMASQLKKYVDKKDISVIPAWGNSGFFKPITKDSNPFIDEHGLKNKFVIIYSGNLGLTHSIDILPEIASLIKNNKIIFLIIGKGEKYNWLNAEIRRRNLSNCRLLPLQPVNKMPLSFAASDLAIVTQGSNISDLGIPSKTYDYMSAGLPLLCLAGENSALNDLIEKYDNGKCFTPDKLEEIVNFINEVASDIKLQEKYRSNSVKASGDFTPRNAEIIAEILEKSIRYPEEVVQKYL